VSAVPRLKPGQHVYWQRPAPDNRWHAEGVGRVHHDHGRTVQLDDGTLLLRGEVRRWLHWFKEKAKPR
jgi:hypothetical protein